MDVADLLHQQGEIARISTLIRRGASRAAIARALDDGRVRRIMPGWVAGNNADAEQISAVRSGGRRGGISALARWGVWSGDDPHPHIAMPQHGRRRRPQPNDGSTTRAVTHPRSKSKATSRPRVLLPARAHWGILPRKGDLDWIISPAEALRQAVCCQELEHAVACVDSALRLGVLSAADWDEIARGLPVSRRECVPLVNGRADSGLESRVRVRLVRLGHTVETQVRVPGFGKIDLLIDGRVGLELDGDAFHSTAEQRQRDAEKVLTSMLFGLPVLRAGYAQAIDDWDLVYEALTRMLQLTPARELSALAL